MVTPNGPRKGDAGPAALPRGDTAVGGSWLLLVYKIPREPAAGRVGVWRKLRRLGAVLLHDAAWVLPATPATREHVQWLAAEIAELDGEATVWEARLAHGDVQALLRQFEEPIDAAYAAILAELARDGADAGELSRRYQQVQARDYFRSTLGQRVREALIAARGRQSP